LRPPLLDLDLEHLALDHLDLDPHLDSGLPLGLDPHLDLDLPLVLDPHLDLALHQTLDPFPALVPALVLELLVLEPHLVLDLPAVASQVHLIRKE